MIGFTIDLLAGRNRRHGGHIGRAGFCLLDFLPVQIPHFAKMTTGWRVLHLSMAWARPTTGR